MLSTMFRRLRPVYFLALVLLLGLVGVSTASDEPGLAVDKFQDAYRAADLPALLEIYADQAVFEDVNQRHHFEGTDQLQEFLGRLVGAHLHMDIEEKRRIVTGNTAVVEIDYVGTLDCSVLGLPDESLPYRMPAVQIFEVEAGRIVRQTDYIDYRTFTELQAEVQKKLEAAAGSS